MRTFFAIPIPEQLKIRIDDLLIPLKKLHPGFNWVKPENHHLTLHFLGEISDNEYDRLKAALRKYKPPISPFDLSFGQIGAFPRLSNPSILYISVVEGGKSVQMIYNSLSELLSKTKIKSDTKKRFKPHLTICRIRKKDYNFTPESFKDISFEEEFRVKHIQIFSSDLSGRSPVYSTLMNINL